MPPVGALATLARHMSDSDAGVRNIPDRRHEWFVPAAGPERLRLAIGLLFLPYTGMVLGFTVIGSMMADTLDWTRVVAIVVIYFLALGIGAHALDAIGSRGAKPWGRHFSARQLAFLAAVSVGVAYAIGIYYMIVYVALLWPIALVEGFFLLAYNLEWFRGRFHTDLWFAVSWGALPVLAGYVMQTNRLSPAVLFMALAMALVSVVEIKASRPYKELKRQAQASSLTRPLESILKAISGATLALALAMVLWRWMGG
jgi:hypothetical protein